MVQKSIQSFYKRKIDEREPIVEVEPLVVGAPLNQF
jgi:hypothetical protein